MILHLAFLFYAFGTLGVMAATLSAIRSDLLPRISKGYVIAIAIGWPVIVAAVVVALGLAVVAVVMRGVAEL